LKLSSVNSVTASDCNFAVGVPTKNKSKEYLNISSESAFVLLGLILPAHSAFISLALFARRGLLFVERPRLAPLAPRGSLVVPYLRKKDLGSSGHSDTFVDRDLHHTHQVSAPEQKYIDKPE
jgi:hypothetical protein